MEAEKAKIPLAGREIQRDPLKLERNVHYQSTGNAWFAEILQRNPLRPCHDSMVFCVKKQSSMLPFKCRSNVRLNIISPLMVILQNHMEGAT